MEANPKGASLYAELLIKQTSLLDPKGDLLRLAREITQEQRGDRLLQFYRLLFSVNSSREHDQELVKAIKLSLLQLCGYHRVVELCREAVKQEEGEIEDTLESCLTELNQLVGLVQVKRIVEDLITYQKIQRKRLEVGLSVPKKTLHLAFMGKPGTGKTTVARIVGRTYKHLGLLSRGHFIEASRTDLIAGYQGQTAIKVKKLIDRAKGGVLFIDEAYSITENEHSDSYGRECLTELTKALEDYREDLVVIVAGYTSPMEYFFKSNPGLRSRFNTFIHFEDYKLDELLQIFQNMCLRDDYLVDQEAMKLLQEHLLNILQDKPDEFSNGRYMRNIYEASVMQHARRIAMITSPSIDDLQVILPSDIVTDKMCLSELK